MNLKTTLTATIATIAAGAACAVPIASADSEQPPTCHGKVATWVGTEGDDYVDDELIEERNPVLVLGGGDDVVEFYAFENVYRDLTICAGDGDDEIADGGRGVDRCRAEIKRRCER